MRTNIAIITLSLCLNASYAFARLLELPSSGRSLVTKSLSGNDTLFESSKVWSLGVKNNTSDVFFVLHGDTPSFYEKELQDDFSKIHSALLKKQKGAIVIQLKSLPSKRLGVPGGQGWSDLYGKSQGGQRNYRKRFLYPESILAIFKQIKTKLYHRQLKMHLVTFSGSGRVDRAFHEYLKINTHKNSIKNFIENEFSSTTSIDAFVHWSFIDASKRPLVKSWNDFMKSYPHINVTMVYDTKRTYSYMADMINEILNEYRGTKTPLPRKATRYNKLTIFPANGHKAAYTEGLYRYILIQL